MMKLYDVEQRVLRKGFQSVKRITKTRIHSAKTTAEYCVVIEILTNINKRNIEIGKKRTNLNFLLIFICLFILQML